MFALNAIGTDIQTSLTGVASFPASLLKLDETKRAKLLRESPRVKEMIAEFIEKYVEMMSKVHRVPTKVKSLSEQMAKLAGFLYENLP